AAAPARLRRPGPRALERPDRALPRPRSRWEHPHRQLLDPGAVLPPAAAPGPAPRDATAGPVHAQEPAAPPAGELPARGAHGGTVPAGDRRPRGRVPPRRRAPRAVQRQGVLRSPALARAPPGFSRRRRARGAALS